MVSKNPNYELETEETEEDTLSLCDLSIYTDATSDTEESLNSSFSSSDHDFFEFFNEKFVPSYPPDTIIFCGKLITHNKPMNLRLDNQSDRINRGLLRRNSDKFEKSNSNLNRWKMREFSSYKDLGKCVSKKKDMSNSPAWSRWQLFVFGLAKIPAEVEVGDSPRPRGRRSPPAVFNGGGGEKEGGCKRRRKGLWGLLRDLGCSGRRRVRLPS